MQHIKSLSSFINDDSNYQQASLFQFKSTPKSTQKPKPKRQHKKKKVQELSKSTTYPLDSKRTVSLNENYQANSDFNTSSEYYPRSIQQNSSPELTPKHKPTRIIGRRKKIPETSSSTTTPLLEAKSSATLHENVKGNNLPVLNTTTNYETVNEWVKSTIGFVNVDNTTSPLNNGWSVLPFPSEVGLVTPQEKYLKMTIDNNEKEYLTLANSDVTGNNVQISHTYSENCVQFMEPEDANFNNMYPGVQVGSFDINEDSVNGYVRISPKTVKPFEITKDLRVVYWVLSGEVIIRSTAFFTQDSVNFAYGKLLKTGSCFVASKFTPYTIENRQTDKIALLGYTILTD